MRYALNPKKSKILRFVVFTVLCGLLLVFWILMIIFFIAVVKNANIAVSIVVLLLITWFGVMSGIKFYQSYIYLSKTK